MGEYFNYLNEMLIRVFADIGEFFNNVFASPWARVPGNFAVYGSYFDAHVNGFHFWGWFFFVLFAILFSAVIGGIVYVLVWLIRKYIRFLRSELDKDELRATVERLNYELYLAIKEKDKILNLKTTYLGLGSPEEKEEAKEELKEMSNRFPKLASVDKQYKGKNMDIPDIEGLSLEELCNAFRHFAASQLHLYYTVDTIRQLFAGMATSKLIILEGISGTGKTSMPYALGKFFTFDASIIPVQPSWKDRSELLGYYNEFTKKFNESEFLKALYISKYRKDLNIIVIDEMNLARIEYYFAEFLSIMEMPNVDDWKIELIGQVLEDDPMKLEEGKLLIPQNVYFFGTANNDDSTFTISDKVYDRAMSLFFDNKGIAFDAEFKDPLHVPWSQMERLFKESFNQFPVSQGMLDKFSTLDNFVIKKFKLAFGNRILKQLNSFIPAYVACGGTEIDGFDFIFTNKILKKFESLNIAFLKDELGELKTQLDKLFGKGNFKMAHAFIDNLIKMN